MAEVCDGECLKHSPGDEPLTLMKAMVVGCHSYMKSLGGSLFAAEPTT